MPTLSDMLIDRASRNTKIPQTIVQSHIGMILACWSELAAVEPGPDATWEVHFKCRERIPTHK